MPIRVVNVRGLNRPNQREQVVYCGRPFAGWAGHRLANPFRPRSLIEDFVNKKAGLEDCLQRYRIWLLARQTLETELAALWEECRHGALPLGCWCCNATTGDGSEVVCHAQVLAEMLNERFGGK